MPQLGITAVTDWVSAYEPSAATGWVTLIQPVEDNPEAETALGDLGRALDDASAARVLLSGVTDDEARSDLHEILSQLGAARLLRLLRWFGCESGPDGSRALEAQFADRYGMEDKLRKLVQALHRQALLARMFDDERLDALLRASRIAAGEPT
jgi:hypothetical protein